MHIEEIPLFYDLLALAIQTDSTRAAMIDSLTHLIAKARDTLESTGGHSVLRRLNAWEYRQTIGDLFDLNIEAWNPAADFPKEVKVVGFDNNGAELVTSGMLLQHYLSAAEEAIRRSTHFGAQPESQKYAQQSPFYFSNGELKEQLPKLFHVDRFRFIPETPYTDLYGRHYRGGHIGFLPLAFGGVPHSGVYTVRVRAAAVDRVHPYQTVLSAPGFLYLAEGEGELTSLALASRLSYFLWSSPPDDALLARAADGTLADPEVLATQVDRLLADGKSNRFVTHFIRRWLELDNIGEMPPSEKFVSYYRDNLETHMRRETETFFRHILDHNLPRRDFIAADYSFLNRELATHYGIDGVEGNQLQRVSLAGTRRHHHPRATDQTSRNKNVCRVPPQDRSDGFCVREFRSRWWLARAIRNEDRHRLDRADA